MVSRTARLKSGCGVFVSYPTLATDAPAGPASKEGWGCDVNSFSDKVSFIWSMAHLLCGPYRPNQYGRVILPLTERRRLDCLLDPAKAKLLKKAAKPIKPK